VRDEVSGPARFSLQNKFMCLMLYAAEWTLSFMEVIMRGRIACFVLLSLVIPVTGNELRCTGAFGIDTSEARLIETFGADNVVRSERSDAREQKPLITTVYPTDPVRRMVFLWWNREKPVDLSHVILPQSAIVPGKLQVGLTIAEVQRLNGGPFNIFGLGSPSPGFTLFHGEALGNLPGGCLVSATFSPSHFPPSLDVSSVMTDRDISSDNPLLSQMDVRLEEITLGYPHPDLR